MIAAATSGVNDETRVFEVDLGAQSELAVVLPIVLFNGTVERAALAAGAVGLFAAVLTFCGPTTELTGSARAQVATERPAMVDEPAGIPPAMLEATGGEAPGSIGEQAAAGADEVPAQASKMSETAATLLGTGMLRSDAASQGKGIANSSIQSYHGKARDVQNNVQM